MKVQRHGLSIGIDRLGNEFILSMKAIGKLTNEDYQIINPMIDSALKGVRKPRIKVYIDGSELEGWELRAAWNDFRLGLKHGGEFDKIAIFGNKNWQKYTSLIGSWFISGDIKYFESADEALTWLQK